MLSAGIILAVQVSGCNVANKLKWSALRPKDGPEIVDRAQRYVLSSSSTDLIILKKKYIYLGLFGRKRRSNLQQLRKKLSPRSSLITPMSVLSFFCDGVDVEMQAQLVKMFAAESRCPTSRTQCIQVTILCYQMGIHDDQPLLKEMQVG